MDKIVDAARVQLLNAALWDRDAVVEVNRFKLTDFDSYTSIAALLAWHDAGNPGAPSYGSDRVSAVMATMNQVITLDRKGREYVRSGGKDAVFSQTYAQLEVPLLLRGMGSDITKGKFLDVVSPPTWADTCPLKHASAALSTFTSERDRLEADHVRKLQLLEARAAARLENLQNQVADQFFATAQPPMALGY